MSDGEVVDLVAPDGALIGRTVSKQDAHVTGELHACVIGQVIDSRGRWLLTRQASDRQDAGQHVSPIGGHVSAGESPETAILREASEELGISGCTPRRDGQAVFDRHVIGRHENHLFIHFTISWDGEPVLNHESDAYRWFARDELVRCLRETPAMFGDSFWFCVKHFHTERLPLFGTIDAPSP